MGRDKLKVLAVADPAVTGYIDEKANILNNYSEKVSMEIVPWDKYYDTMMAALSGKVKYDIVMVAGHLWKCDFINNGYLKELTYETEDILPVIAKEMKYKNKIYLSPSFCDGHMIVYRKSIIKKVTGGLLQSVITPQEYMEVAEKLSGSGYKIAMKAAQSEIFTDALPFLRMNGNDVYVEETGEVQCNTPDIINGLEHYCKLKKFACEGTENFGNDEIAEKIKKKEAAMAVTWSGQLGVVWEQDCLEKEDLGFAAFSTAWNVTWSFGVSASSGNVERAADFLKFLRMPQVDVIAGNRSGAPVRLGSYEKGKLQFPWYECQLKMFEHAKPLPDMIDAGMKNEVFYQEIHKAFQKEISAKEAMKHVQDTIEQMQGVK